MTERKNITISKVLRSDFRLPQIAPKVRYFAVSDAYFIEITRLAVVRPHDSRLDAYFIEITRLAVVRPHDSTSSERLV